MLCAVKNEGVIELRGIDRRADECANMLRDALTRERAGEGSGVN